ncbi:MAG: pyruvate, phosphate dikinase [Candidatus Puniceispirillaceae bacterium]
MANRTENETKWVYSFGASACDGDASMRHLLGGKGANLAEMASIGLPVPPGFTITTALCNQYYEDGKTYPESLKGQVEQALLRLEEETGLTFADPKNPLLLSVRSGARASMPGMMDTVLNLGLNDATCDGLAAKSGDERFAYDSYRRFIQMYSDVVLGVDHGLFEDRLEDMKMANGLYEDTDLSADHLRDLVAQYKQIVQDELDAPFPQDAQAQLWGAIGAVFASWMNPRANTYRKLNNIPAAWGTAVNVQAMVFGNMGDDCATGVAFTRDPSTGANEFYGEFLINAQGEDVVAGIRTPLHLTKQARLQAGEDELSLEEVMPEVFSQLSDVRTKLETHYGDMQDLEFTIQQHKLYMLQTRNGKRTAEAAMKIAVDMAQEGTISVEDALLRIEPESIDQLLHPTLDPTAERDLLGRGLPASPGAACGQICLTADKAEQLAAQGLSVILVRVETSPEDIHGMHAAAGILTARGGMTSHAAVVARGMGRACVSGAGDLRIDMKTGQVHMAGRQFAEGDIITIDGSAGEVYAGTVATVEPQLSGDFETIMTWADKARRMSVRANAETELDTKKARHFGAEGIGLCRTEHMFFDADRIISMREMIMATDAQGRQAALDKLLPMQQADFEKLFDIMAGLPVTIRLLDPPLHEFLPHSDSELEDVAKVAGITIDKARQRAMQLAESNPMLGHRGCRLAITYPEICAMQARAIFQAAIAIAQTAKAPIPEIMVPLAGSAAEIAICRAIIDETAQSVFAETGKQIDYLVGTMVELPRAALLADELAQEAEFFSFGTNDLTQTALGISRDDAASFLHAYEEKGIYEIDPFVSIDQKGVGALVRTGAEKGRDARTDIKLGICGEHGGDPASISFFESVGLDYISCSPFRVPIARLAAAQAALRQKS